MMAVIWVRPQDLTFTKEELEKAFGKKQTREHFWRTFKKQYGYRKEGDDDGRERSAESNTIRFA